MRQTQGKPKKVLYKVLGVALVDRWEDGFFILEGFSPSHQSEGAASTGAPEPLSLPGASQPPSDSFDPTSIEDARQRTLQAITQRQGQGNFRKKLLEVYQGACVVTGYQVPEALEAAHIVPYMGKATNALSNGLLLRADIHTLFDLGLLAIDEQEKAVVLDPSLRSSSYADLHGKRIASPSTSEALPSKLALEQHRIGSGLPRHTEGEHGS